MKRKYLENEGYFYQITQREDGKYISIDGYYYKGDEDNGRGFDRAVSFSGLEIPLQEFVNYPAEYRNDNDLAVLRRS